MKLFPVIAGAVAAFLALNGGHILNAGAFACGLTQSEADGVGQRYALGEPSTSLPASGDIACSTGPGQQFIPMIGSNSGTLATAQRSSPATCQ